MCIRNWLVMCIMHDALSTQSKDHGTQQHTKFSIRIPQYKALCTTSQDLARLLAGYL